LCNNYPPNTYFIYPDKFQGRQQVREEDKYLRYAYTPANPFFLNDAELAIYESKCTGGTCTRAPYPTYDQPICQCKEILDPVAFTKGTDDMKAEMIAKYDVYLPFTNG